jgi:protein-S-isoprenylcysteine O-methyltransferase Ste14
MLPCVVFFLRRVGVEDRFLHESLPGYRAYAARVRARLIPLVW